MILVVFSVLYTNKYKFQLFKWRRAYGHAGMANGKPKPGKWKARESAGKPGKPEKPESQKARKKPPGSGKLESCQLIRLSGFPAFFLAIQLSSFPWKDDGTEKQVY